tara:strand:+ start:12061 stop:13494 length:1434 start_codon:yes stop_codon:yes gene_type:complete
MGFLKDLKDKFVDDIIPNEFKSGEKMKKTIRNLIPNELADVAVKAAPFVAPFNPGIAAAMRGIGRFDQRGSISDALKQAAATGAFGYAAGKIPGTGDYFGKGFEGAKALGSDAMSGITSIFKGGGKNAANEILEQAGTADDVYPGMKKSGGIMDSIRNLGGKVKDKSLEYVLGDDKEFQFSDITDFISDPKKIIPTLMLGTYIKEKFFPGEKEEDPYDKYLAERKADVESYLRLYGPQNFRRDVPNNPFTEEEIEQFVYDNTPEYRRDTAASGGIMSVPRENYFLGSMKDKFKKSAVIGPIEGRPKPLGKGLDPEIVLQLFKDKFKGGMGSGKGKALPKFLPRTISNTVTAEDITLPMMQKEDDGGLGKLIAMALRDANFDRVNRAYGSDDKVEQASMIEDLDININPKGVKELDMRETGGFIPPVGVKEKADDIPAMLSNNEFVFTADAVRAAGGGSVDKGAQRMYKMMKELEAKV